MSKTRKDIQKYNNDKYNEYYAEDNYNIKETKKNKSKQRRFDRAIATKDINILCDDKFIYDDDWN